MELNAYAQKKNILVALEKINTYLNNYREKVHPEKVAEILDAQAAIEEKARKVFQADEELDGLLSEISEKLRAQEKLIAHQETRLQRYDEGKSEEQSDDTYEGVVIHELL